MVRRRVWLLVLAAVALAQDPNAEIREARQTLDEFLKIADELVREGKHEAALKTYREAVKAYDEAMRRIEAALLNESPKPPMDLAHLDGLPADLRRRIDDLVAVMMDPRSGRDALDAQTQLRAMGKAAFPRVLDAMFKVRDRITDRDATEKHELESTLKLGDQCLRGLDGYLDARHEALLRPGAQKDHIDHVLREHYRRWTDKLKDLDEMPGPYRPNPARPGTSRWDPPATLGHLESTPAAQRKEIDKLVDLLLDPQAGRDSIVAQKKLAALGKPVFPVILGRMAAIRDKLTDNDTIEERLIESSLKLADECLRAIDPYLDEKRKAPIRPGTDAKYVVYILRLHYRRWTEVLSKEDD